MKRWLLVLIVALGIVSPTYAQDDVKTYSAEGITLNYPANWYVCDADAESVTFANMQRDECDVGSTIEPGLVTVKVTYAGVGNDQGDSEDEPFTFADESPEFMMPFFAGSTLAIYLIQMFWLMGTSSAKFGKL